MHVIVVGAGIIGVTTAYYLRRHGLDVTVVERCAGAAQETSFANAGVIAPAYVAPWSQPGMPGKILSYLFKPEAPVIFRPRLDWSLWRWLLRWYSECSLERYLRNKARMQRLARYSRNELHRVRERYAIDYEQAQGYLQLFRTEQEIARTAPARTMLKEAGVPHELLDAAQCREVEPALNAGAPLAGGLLLPEDEVGNCAYFARRLKEIGENEGVHYRFNAAVTSIAVDGGSARGVVVDNERIEADAVVIAGGIDSTLLLRPLGIDLPLYPVKGYSATATIVRHEEAPLMSIMDESYKVAVTRLGNRLRIAGTAEIGSRELTLRDAALRTLMKVARDWYPAAAAYGQAQYWVGARPMLPDGPPVLGTSTVAGLYLNVGHGSTGWTMACGSGRVVADLIAGVDPEIDLEGLTLDRYLSV
jgi:D-amino-acid dehydrogenase